MAGLAGFLFSLSARLADPYAHDDTGDARRHFRWTFKMTRALGAERATAFANRHEVSGDDRPAEHEMDLHNNAVGRAMARDPRFRLKKWLRLLYAMAAFKQDRNDDGQDHRVLLLLFGSSIRLVFWRAIPGNLP